jgi:hypothetical protein
MKIHLLRLRVLTDEHPRAAKGTSVSIDLATRKTYHPGDNKGVSAQQVFPWLKRGGKIISCPEVNSFLKEGNHEINRSVRPHG